MWLLCCKPSCTRTIITGAILMFVSRYHALPGLSDPDFLNLLSSGSVHATLSGAFFRSFLMLIKEHVCSLLVMRSPFWNLLEQLNHGSSEPCVTRFGIF